MEYDVKQQTCGIYKITNLIDEKVYIGQSINIPTRWAAHKSSAFRTNCKAYNSPLYRAIRKYGLDNFEFSIIEYCSPEQLNEREVYWIKVYDSFKNDEKGYNLTPGGKEPVVAVPSEIYQKWDEGFTVAELCKYFNLNKSTVHKYLVLYKNFSTREARSRGVNKHLKSISKIKPIIQYDLQGNFIKKWDCSPNNIQKQTGFNHTCIFMCLKQEHFKAYGYRWGYENEPLMSEEDFYARVRQRNKESNAHNYTVNDEQVLYIKKELAKGRTQQSIADELNIDRHVVTKINTGKHFNDNGIYPIYNRKTKQTNRPELLNN